MQIQITKWGNSLGLRLPQALASQIGVAAGQKVEVTAEGNRLVIQAAASAYRLEDLLTNMTPKAMSEAFDWGGDVGREAVDD
jgi:antitoxin MazE